MRSLIIRFKPFGKIQCELKSDRIKELLTANTEVSTSAMALFKKHGIVS
jgi:ribosomal protein S16